MKQIRTKSGEILCVEFPEEAYLIDSVDNPKFKYSVRFVNCPEINNVEYKELETLGKLSELTDKDCEEFVEFNFPFDGQYIKIYKNYYYVPLEPWDTTPWYNSSKESFISLLQSESVDTSNEDKLLIIKIL